MPWDDLHLTDKNGRRRSLADALRELFATDDGQSVVAMDASVAKKRAYLAVRTTDGQVRPCYLWLAPATEFGSVDPHSPPYVMRKTMPIAESPRRWPLTVAEALTTWDS